MDNATDLPDFMQGMEDEAAKDTETNDTSRVEAAIARALALEEEIADGEEKVKALKKDLEGIMGSMLPQLMQQAGVVEFGTADGSRIKLGPKAYGSLRQAPNEEEAVAYLEANGFEGGVLTKLVMDFTESEREAAAEAAKNLSEATHKQATLGRQINAQTLMAFCREKVAEDPTFDAAKVGVTVFTAAKFTKRGKPTTTSE